MKPEPGSRVLRRGFGFARRVTRVPIWDGRREHVMVVRTWQVGPFRFMRWHWES